MRSDGDRSAPWPLSSIVTTNPGGTFGETCGPAPALQSGYGIPGASHWRHAASTTRLRYTAGRFDDVIFDDDTESSSCREYEAAMSGKAPAIAGRVYWIMVRAVLGASLSSGAGKRP
jgi:hypothetical protein